MWANKRTRNCEKLYDNVSYTQRNASKHEEMSAERWVNEGKLQKPMEESKKQTRKSKRNTGKQKKYTKYSRNIEPKWRKNHEESHEKWNKTRKSMGKVEYKTSGERKKIK